MESIPPAVRSRSRTVAVAVIPVAIIGVLVTWLLWQHMGRIQVGENDWPWWRGRQQANQASQAAPAEWSETQHVLWKVELPGRGHGSPIVHDQAILLATAEEQAKVLSLLCFDHQTGMQRWSCELQRGELMHKSIKNTYASASAACDGSRVFYPWIADDALWMAAVDLQGQLLWKQKVAPFESEHGYASSPCLYESLVIVPSDNLGPSYLTALDRASGKLVWQVPRGNGGSYASPVIASIAGRDQLLLSGQNSVVSYDPSSGRVWWQCAGPGASTIGSAAWYDRLVFVTCGAPPMIAGVMAIDADQGRVAWQADAMALVPSPLVVGDRLLVTEDRGTVVCFAALTGQQLWKERLGGNFSASPVLAGDLVYLPNEAGKLFVFRAGEQFELVSENDLGEGGFASPVVAGGRIYLRTNQHLYCIGE